MVITLGPELETALNEAAREQGVGPEAVALNALRERFLGLAAALQPRDEWERGLLEAARECGVSLPDAALSSEAPCATGESFGSPVLFVPCHKIRPSFTR